MGQNIASNGKTFQLKAGMQILAGDVVEIGPDGKGYQAICTDYAAVTNCTYGTAQTSTATGRIFAETTVNSSDFGFFHRKFTVQTSDGGILVASPNGASQQGLKVTKYSANGVLVGSITLSSTPSTLESPMIIALENDRFAVFSELSSYAYYAVIDKNLKVIKANAAAHGASTPTKYDYDACSLVGGGFALCVRDNNDTQKIKTFDADGTVVLAATTIQAWTGAANAVKTFIQRLSNDNLLVVCNSQYSTTTGLYHGIYQPDGTPVLAMTNIQTAGGASDMLDVENLYGYYGIVLCDGTDTKAWVHSVAGGLQGTPYSIANTSSGNTKSVAIVASSTEFFATFPLATDSTRRIVKVPTSGTGYTIANCTVTSPASNYSAVMDAFYDNGFVVGFTIVTGAKDFFWVYDIASDGLRAAVGTEFGLTGNNGYGPCAIPGGDYSFIYTCDSTATLILSAGKYANTSVIGVAAASAASDSYCNIKQDAGAYAVTALKGSPSVSFDHSAANIVGNRGTLLNNGAVLKGF